MNIDLSLCKPLIFPLPRKKKKKHSGDIFIGDHRKVVTFHQNSCNKQLAKMPIHCWKPEVKYALTGSGVMSNNNRSKHVVGEKSGFVVLWGISCRNEGSRLTAFFSFALTVTVCETNQNHGIRNGRLSS